MLDVFEFEMVLNTCAVALASHCYVANPEDRRYGESGCGTTGRVSGDIGMYQRAGEKEDNATRFTSMQGLRCRTPIMFLSIDYYYYLVTLDRGSL